MGDRYSIFAAATALEHAADFPHIAQTPAYQGVNAHPTSQSGMVGTVSRSRDARAKKLWCTLIMMALLAEKTMGFWSPWLFSPLW